MRVLSVLLGLAVLPSLLAIKPIQSFRQSIDHSLIEIADHQSIDESIMPVATHELGASQQVTFTLVTRQAAWPARAMFSVSMLNRSMTGSNPVTGNRVVLSSPVFVLHGGEIVDESIDQLISASNDVWASSDAKLWILSAGVTTEGAEAPGGAAFSSFENRRAAAVATDIAANKLYRIGGQQFDGRHRDLDEVWTTSDGVSWNDESENTWSPIDGDRTEGAATADASGRLFVVGGVAPKSTKSINDPIDQSQYRADVWLSTNGGLEWRQQSSEAKFGARGSASLVSLPINQEIDQSVTVDQSVHQALILIGGQTPESKSNEIWMSDDLGVTWAMSSSRAPFSRRSSTNALITKDGLIVLVGGMESPSRNQSIDRPTNDVWVSMDGGWTWGQCASSVAWSGRRNQQSVIGSDGYLYVMGGYQSISQSNDQSMDDSELNDVWRSSVSFHDLHSVSNECNLSIPKCGSGLKCLSNSGTVIAADGSFVSCSQCAVYNNQSITPLWIAISFAIAGGTAFLITLVTLCCFIKQRTNNQSIDQPINQTAWSDVQSNQSINQSINQSTNQSTNQQWWPSDHGHEPIHIQTNDGYEQTQPSTEFTPMRN